jgi:hypothetical protein
MCASAASSRFVPAPPAAASAPIPTPAWSTDAVPESSAGGGAEAILERAPQRRQRRPRAAPGKPVLYRRAPRQSANPHAPQYGKAHALVPPKLWEAPKVEELVNQTGDGARRTRTITALRTGCITERSPVTNVDMIEMHGKLRLTNCPQHEDTATQQAWRTARD